MAFLFLAPFTAFATTTYTVTITSPTAGALVKSGTPITVSGTVSPAPTSSSTYIAISIVEPNGQLADANEFLVATSTGAFSGTFTPGPSYSVNGTYTVNVNYDNALASVSFTYGSSVTSSVTGVTTTVSAFTTTTVTAVVAPVTTVISTGTTVITTVSSITTVISSSVASDATALAIGAVGVIIAIIAAVLAVLAMRKKK